MSLRICSQKKTLQFALSKKLCDFENRLRLEIADFGQPCSTARRVRTRRREEQGGVVSPQFAIGPASLTQARGGKNISLDILARALAGTPVADLRF